MPSPVPLLLLLAATATAAAAAAAPPGSMLPTSPRRRGDIRPLPLRPAVVASSSSAPAIVAQACDSGAPWQTWSYTASGQVQLNSTTCLTSAVWPVVDGTALITAPCVPGGTPAQLFNYTPSPSTPGNAISLTLSAAPTFCVNIAGYGKTAGSQIWLYTCNPTDCEQNCAWASSAPPPAPGLLSNPDSGLCIDSSTGPPVPHTCDPGSPSADLPFCNPTLDLDTRIDDLWSRLENETIIGLFSIPIQPNAPNKTLNLPSIYWDITCSVTGLSPGRFSPQPNVSVWPISLGQAASFDLNLTTRIAMATALEGRIVNQINYRLTGGTTWQGVLCDGGPLANSQHVPTWGRISEAYSEDVWLTSAFGSTATRALQQRTAPDASGIDWLMTSQVTRHFMGTHGASDLPNDAEEYILPQFREEHQLRIYEAFLHPQMGDSEGVMCAISAFAEAGDTPPPRNDPGNGSLPWIPNCANPYLLDTKLRTEWGSGAFIQSDCCDSIDSVVNHRYTTTLEDAVAAVVNTGLGSSYGNPSGITAALVSALADGKISADTYERRIKRTLRSLFRVGMFDTSNPNNPYAGPWDESLLDSAEHRALAREAVARTTVLLENRNAVLPLPAFPASVAVIGPFSDCTDLAGGYGGHDSDGGGTGTYTCNYGHSYSGFMSSVSTYRSAALEEAAAAGSSVAWVRGSRVLHADGTTGLSNATAAAAAADLVLLVLGTGTQIEVEGLDRTNLTLPDAQLALVDAVKAGLAPTAKLVVVLVTAGTVDFEDSRADAVLYAPYAGEEAGHGLWDLVLGRAMPSARLPLTAFRWPYLTISAPTANFNMITATAGFPVGRTYRYFNDSAAMEATGSTDSFILYKFGFGLSFCTFTYSNLQVQPQADNSVTVQVDVAVASRQPGVNASLPCREATQVYVTLPSVVPGLVVPIYSLAAFSSTELPSAGDPTHLHFAVPADAFLTTFANGTRALTGGSYTVAVSGHLPDDAKGIAQGSNVLTAQVPLPWSG
jgi:beta-glucosidase